MKRGLRTWPRGTGWPVQISKAVGTNQSPGQRVSPSTDAKAANLELAEKQQIELAHQTEKQIDSGRKDSIGDNRKFALFIIPRQRNKILIQSFQQINLS